MQHAQNIRAKIVLNKSSRDSITECLGKLHWLPIKQRIDLNILTLIFKSLNRQTPKYLQELIIKKEDRREGLRSNTQHNLLEIPTTKRKTFASGAFSTCRPTKQTHPPNNLCICVSLDTFKKSLKTNLFKLVHYLIHCKVSFIIYFAFHIVLYQIL